MGQCQLDCHEWGPGGLLSGQHDQPFSANLWLGSYAQQHGRDTVQCTWQQGIPVAWAEQVKIVHMVCNMISRIAPSWAQLHMS